MIRENPEPLPQFVDRFLSRTAMGVLTMASAYALGTALFFLEGPWATWLDRLQGVLALVAVVVVLPVFVRYVALRRQGHCRGVESDGFVSGVFQKACSRGFTATFVLLVFLEPLSNRFLTTLPPPFFLNLALAVSLGVFGLSFFALARVDDDDPDEFEEEPGE